MRLFMMNILVFLTTVLTVMGCSMGRDMQEFDDEDELNFGDPLPPDARPSKMGWSGSQKFIQGSGKSFTIQADFPRPGTYTIQFGLRLPKERADVGLVQGSTPTRVNAEIIWTVEGNTVSREITIGDGTQISGTGQAVTVRITDNCEEENGIPPAGDEYTVAVTVTPGVRASKEQPPILLSEYTNALAGVRGLVVLEGGTTHDIPIPQNSGVISFFQSMRLIDETAAGSPWPILVQQIYKGASPVTILEYHDLRDDGMNGKWIPLCPGANYLRVTFNDPDPLMTAYLSTLFGIDG